MDESQVDLKLLIMHFLRRALLLFVWMFGVCLLGLWKFDVFHGIGTRD